MKRITKENLRKGENIILLITSLALFILAYTFLFEGVSLHYAGFKNIDLVYNWQDLRNQLNPIISDCTKYQLDSVDNVIDTGNTGIENYTLSDWYLIGSNQMDSSLIYLFFSGICLAGALGLNLITILKIWRKL